ncbi:MAG: hypothetical protein LUG91_11095 [Ruminococcus sp.]|nr:hypothetical protein [Ruminococcus sp.]
MKFYEVTAKSDSPTENPQGCRSKRDIFEASSRKARLTHKKRQPHGNSAGLPE